MYSAPPKLLTEEMKAVEPISNLKHCEGVTGIDTKEAVDDGIWRFDNLDDDTLELVMMVLDQAGVHNDGGF